MGEMDAVHGDGDRAFPRVEQLYPQHRACRRASWRSSSCSTGSCYNKWYFDELYNILFVKPAFAIGRFFWKRGDEGTIDRFGPDGAAGARRWGDPSRGPAAIGLCLWICVCDAARSCRPRQLGHGEFPVSGFPILSLMLAVPAIAAIACLFVGDKMSRFVALGATLVTFVLGCILWANFDIGGAQWQFTERADLFGRFQWALGIDGMALMLIMLSVFLMPLCILASWDAIKQARRRLYGDVPDHGSRDDRRLHGAGFAALLHLLRSRPDPDVFHHRHLGRREPQICGRSNSSSTRCSDRC